jgi:hypothetical protein
VPNYDQPYLGPAASLLQLRDELNDVFPGRYTGTDGFVTGYGKNQITGHNPDKYGRCMAFDISTPANGQQIDEPTGRALADFLRTQCNTRFRYLIHDMSADAPAPKIASDNTKFAWWNYDGPEAHSDHIHLSLTDDYAWGDDCGLSPSVYNDRSSWGIAAWYAAYKAGKPLSNVVTPIKPSPAKKVSEMPTYKRVPANSPKKPVQLGAGSPWTLKDETGRINQNYGVNGLGHYDIDLFLSGTELPAGEYLEIVFYLIPTGGKKSAYFRDRVVGTKDGTFAGSTRFSMPVLKAARIEVDVRATSRAVLADYRAEVKTWAK